MSAKGGTQRSVSTHNARTKSTCRNFCARVVSAAIRSKTVFVLLLAAASGLANLFSESYRLLGISPAKGDIADYLHARLGLEGAFWKCV